jgi:ABC-type Fe3+ transport system substrate-binding protein
VELHPIKALVLAAAALVSIGASHARAASQTLIDAAKKEGRVTWYTTSIVDQIVRPVAEAFEKKYGIHVDYVRTDTSGIELRMVSEEKAGHPQDDVFDGTTTVAGLEKVGLAAKWLPDDAAILPKPFVDPHGYWVATNLYVLTPAFNVSLAPRGTEPRSFADLLDPKWKGKIVWAFTESASAAPGFIGLTLASMGPTKGLAYLKRLAPQGISSVNASARQVLNQVISGEYAIGLQMFNDQVAVSASQGAPIDWIRMNPAMSVLLAVSLNTHAPHPNAGKLLIDYLVSDEGQELFRKAKYLTVNPRVPPLDPSQKPDGVKFRTIYFTPEQIEDAMPSWVAVYNKLFR